MKLGICGTGGLAREVYALARICNEHLSRWESFFFIDIEPTLKLFQEEKVFTMEGMSSQFSNEEVEIVIAVGEPSLREKIWHEVSSYGYNFATLIHPNIHVSKCCSIGAGCIINNYVAITCDVTIGNNVYIQPFVTIGHDTVVEAHCIISPHAFVAGNVHIKSCVYIAGGASIKQGLKIGECSTIGMGSVVLRHIPSNVVVFGNPAKVMLKK